MKRVLSAAVFTLVITFAHSAYCGKMDLLTKTIVSSSRSAPGWVKDLKSGPMGDAIPLLVKANDKSAVVEMIEACGGEVGSSSATVISAKIPSSCVPEIANSSVVDFVEFTPPLQKKMNTAGPVSFVDVVQNGTGLGTAYTGTNVVVGIIDDGLDYGNADFGGIENSRVQYVQQNVDDSQVTCVKSQIRAGNCAIEDGGQGTYHGTHVTGIAAGSNATYVGVAPTADIMFVFFDSTDADPSGSYGSAILDGVGKIFSKADVIDKAAVVNMSLGTSLGAHDGTSALEQGLAEYSASAPARILVGAAGNEQVIQAQWDAADQPYVGGIHSSIAATDGTSAASRMAIWSGAGSASGYLGGTVVDMWFDAGQASTCSIALLGYTGGRAARDYLFPGVSTSSDATLYTLDIPMSVETTVPKVATSEDGKVKVSVTVDPSNPSNSKPHAQIIIEPAGISSTPLESYWYDVVTRASGGNCTGNMWLYYDYTA